MDLETWISLLLSAAFGALISYLFYLRGRNIRTLDYRIIECHALISDESLTREGRISVSSGGRELSAPWITLIRFENTGRSTIKRSDYSVDITIRYEINPPFAATVVDEPVADIVGPVDFVRNNAVMRPERLSAGDSFQVQLLSNGEPGEITATCRFDDEHRPMKRLATPYWNYPSGRRYEIRSELSPRYWSKTTLRTVAVTPMLFCLSFFIIVAVRSVFGFDSQDSLLTSIFTLYLTGGLAYVVMRYFNRKFSNAK